jgi:outer membrane protein assembly factor BamB
MRWLTQRAPTIDGDRLYAVSLLGEVVCLRTKDGVELWRRRYLDELAGQQPIFGYGDCPLVDGERVICTPGGEDNTVVALDRETGSTVWNCAVAGCGRASHSSGVVADIAGQRQVVTFLGESLVGVATDDGTLLWRDDSAVDRVFHPNPPLVLGNELVLVNGSGPGIRRVEIINGDGGYTTREIFAFESNHFDRFHDAAFLIDGYLYEITRIDTCFDCTSGEVVWRQRRHSRPASGTWADGRFYIHSADGLMKLYEATPEGCEEKGSLVLADHQRMSGATAPVVAGGRLYVREDTRLFCYDVRQQSIGTTSSPQRVAIAKLATVVIQNESTGRGNDPRRIVNSVFTPTPQDVVARMLELAAVKTDDVVFDLGSGDGRIVITAARTYGCRAVGYEIDGQLVTDSRAAATKAEVDKLVTFYRADLFTADLKEADVVTLFLLPIQNKRLIPMLQNLDAGTRIVTHQFEIPGIVADKVIHVESDDSGERHKLSLYTVPLSEADVEER